MVDLDAHEQGDIRDAEEHYAMEHPPENYVKLTMLMAVEKERDALRAEVARLRELLRRAEVHLRYEQLAFIRAGLADEIRSALDVAKGGDDAR